MIQREITYLHDDVIKYMEKVRTNNPKDYRKLNIMILKLAEKGHTILDGRMYKMIKTSEKTKPLIIQLKIITKKYRIHMALTSTHLHILHAFDKKRNKTPKNDLEIALRRIKSI